MFTSTENPESFLTSHRIQNGCLTLAKMISLSGPLTSTNMPWDNGAGIYWFKSGLNMSTM